MMFGLPTKKLPNEQRHWIRENQKYALTLTQTDPKADIPYGCYARMNQIFIDTEIKTKGTNLIDLGRSFNEYSKKVGYHKGGARQLKWQLGNLIRCAINISVRDSRQDAGVASLTGRKWFISLDERSPNQTELFRSRILLDEAYADYIFKHAVPLDMDVVRYFKRNPLALDFYRFLAYRNNDLSKPMVMPDAGLFQQLGTSIADDKLIRYRLKTILEKIQAFWKVRAKFEGEQFHLFPSPPAVPQKNPLSRRLRIVHNFDEN